MIAEAGLYNAAVDLVERNLAAGRGGKLAVVDDAGRYTYAQLAERVDRAANAFGALGIARGERVILGLHDGIDFPTCFLGAIKAGVVPVPINTMFSPADYAFVLENSEASAALVSEPLLDAYLEGARAAGWRGTFVLSCGERSGVRRLDDLLAAAPPAFTAAPTRADETAFWLYSSGSTGKPKGALHRHASLMQTADLYARQVLELRESDVVFSAAKLFFAYGLGNSLTFPMSVGATAVLLSARPKPEAVARVMVDHAVTVFCGVPTLYGAILASGELPARGASPLRVCTSAGEALPQHVGEAWRERTGVDIVDGIGSTEMLHIFVSTRPQGVRYGVTGTPVPGYRVRLVDERGADVQPGELGEMLIDGPTAFTSYWKDAERTAKAFEGTWVRTGDKFYRDPSGDYVHCGRTDDMIKAGGIWVSPNEVEGALLGHAAVLEAAVIGAPDESGLMKPKAFVVLRPGFVGDAPLTASLQAHVKERLAPYKFPRWIEFVDELPKTATGKIRRHLLRQAEAATSG